MEPAKAIGRGTLQGSLNLIAVGRQAIDDAQPSRDRSDAEGGLGLDQFLDALFEHRIDQPPRKLLLGPWEEGSLIIGFLHSLPDRWRRVYRFVFVPIDRPVIKWGPQYVAQAIKLT